MRLLDDVALRLRRADMLQALAVGFVALAFVLALRWPIGAGDVNEVWFVMAPVRLALLTVAGIVFGAVWGAGGQSDPRPDGSPAPAPLAGTEGRATLLALFAMTALTWPFEVAGHAASYPDVSFARSGLLPFLAVAASFALGGWLAAAVRAAKLTALLPVALIVVVGLALWLEYASGVNLLNPVRAVLETDGVYLAFNAALAVSLAPVLLRREQRAAQ